MTRLASSPAPAAPPDPGPARLCLCRACRKVRFRRDTVRLGPGRVCRGCLTPPPGPRSEETWPAA